MRYSSAIKPGFGNYGRFRNYGSETTETTKARFRNYNFRIQKLAQGVWVWFAVRFTVRLGLLYGWFRVGGFRFGLGPGAGNTCCGTRSLGHARESDRQNEQLRYGCGSKKGTQNGTLVNGNKDSTCGPLVVYF